MDNCKQCSFPVKDVSNCNVMKAFSSLCIEMPGMSQCNDWISFCAKNKDAAPSICSKTVAGDIPSAAVNKRFHLEALSVLIVFVVSILI